MSPKPQPGYRRRLGMSLLMGAAVVISGVGLVYLRTSPPPPTSQRSAKSEGSVSPLSLTTQRASASPTARSVSVTHLAKLNARMQGIGTGPKPELVASELMEFSRTLHADELQALLEAQFANGVDPQMARTLLSAWQGKDRERAGHWLRAHAHHPGAADLAKAFVIAWGQDDIHSSLRWAQEWPGSDRQPEIVLAAGFETAREDAVAALTAAALLPPSPERDRLIVHATMEWAAARPADALAWAERVSSPELANRLTNAALVSGSDVDPRTAASLADVKLSREATVGIATRWVQQEPEAAAAWVLNQKSDAASRAAAEQLTRIWARYDSTAAGQWLNEMPPGELRDLMLRTLDRSRGLSSNR